MTVSSKKHLRLRRKKEANVIAFVNSFYHSENNLVAGMTRGAGAEGEYGTGQAGGFDDFSCVRNLRYIIFGWDDLTVDLPFVQFMGVGLGHKLAWQ